MDSAVNDGFARHPRNLYPKASALQGVISLIRAETWARINQLPVKGALNTKCESGKVMRIDKHRDGLPAGQMNRLLSGVPKTSPSQFALS